MQSNDKKRHAEDTTEDVFIKTIQDIAGPEAGFFQDFDSKPDAQVQETLERLKRDILAENLALMS